MSSRDLSADGTKLPIHSIPTLKPLSRYSEAIRSLRSGVHMTDVDHPPKIVQITSALPEEGKTTISLSLAASAASGKLRVLYIDADLRHPSATRVFGLQNEPGLVDLLVGDTTIETAIRFYESGGYWTIGAGGKTQNPTDLLNSERMKSLVAGLPGKYDLIVIDTPPTGLVVDPVIVSGYSDKIIMIVRWGVTARELVKETVERLSGHRKSPASPLIWSTNVRRRNTVRTPIPIIMAGATIKNITADTARRTILFAYRQECALLSSVRCAG